MTVSCHVHDVGKGAAGGGGAEGTDSVRGPSVPFSRPSDMPEEAKVKVCVPFFFFFFLLGLLWASLDFRLLWTLDFFGLWTSLDFFFFFFRVQ